LQPFHRAQRNAMRTVSGYDSAAKQPTSGIFRAAGVRASGYLLFAETSAVV
jgi:hypothetical protein